MQKRIIEAGIRVLKTEGALGFTTTRVADAANISVGSLYQYFPNKHALVMAIHGEFVHDGLEHITSILTDNSISQRQKLVDIVRWFFENEAREVDELGSVVGDLGVFLHERHDSATEQDVATRRTFEEALGLAEPQAAYAIAVVRSVGKAAATERLPNAELLDWADQTSSMLADHLDLV